MSKTYIKLEGVDKVIKEIQKAMKGTRQQSYKALIECAILIRRDMASSTPKVPVDTRNLESSWFVTTVGSKMGLGAKFKGKDSGVLGANHASTISESASETWAAKQPLLIMGFSAFYAAYVHEMELSKTGNNIKWKRPGAGPKFLESSLNRNKGQLIEILRKGTKL